MDIDIDIDKMNFVFQSSNLMVAQIFEVWIINLCTAAIDMFPVLKEITEGH